MKQTVLVVCCLLFIPLQAAAQPVVQFDRPTYDFSIVSQKESVEHTFEFTNRGDRELVIEQITPS